MKGGSPIRSAIIGVVTGVALTWLFVAWARAWRLEQPSLPLFLVVILAVMFPAVLAHETGHLLGAWLAGLRILYFAVGPVSMARERGGWRFGWSRVLRSGGAVIASDPSGGRNIRWRLLGMVATGPLASLALPVVCFAVVRLVLDRSSPFVMPGLWLGLLSLAFGVVAIVPMQSGRFFNDGARIVMLLSGGPEAERWCAYAVLFGASTEGRRPRDWDPALVRKLTVPRDGSFDDVGASLLAYYAALDAGRVEEAGALLDHALAHHAAWPPAFRSTLFLEAAYFEARHRAHPAIARACLRQVRGPVMAERHTVHRAEAAVLLAEGKLAEAHSAAGEGLATCPSSSHLGLAQAEAEWLRGLKAGGGFG